MPLSMPPDELRGPSLDEATYQARAQAIQQNEAFQNRVSEALTLRYADKEPSPYVEQRIYDGFIENSDKELCAHFHEVPWSTRIELCDRFQRDLLRHLADPKARQSARGVITRV